VTLPLVITLSSLDPKATLMVDADRELEAAWTAAAVMWGIPVRRGVPGGPPLTHDFDIHLNDGREVALEVTSSTVQEVKEMWDAILQLDWACPELTEGWSISLRSATRGSAGARVRQFRKEGPRWLSVLEQEHKARFGDVLNQAPNGMSLRAAEAVAHLKNLGARSGGSVGLPRSGPALVVVGTVGPGGNVDGSSINEFVEDAAVENLSKLLRATADERHLFIWVDGTDSAGNVAMATFAVPSAPPELPDGIDIVWVALCLQGASYQTNAFALWRLIPPNGWEIVTLPSVRSYAESRSPKQTG
jgi:hypothetical protein